MVLSTRRLAGRWVALSLTARRRPKSQHILTATCRHTDMPSNDDNGCSSSVHVHRINEVLLLLCHVYFVHGLLSSAFLGGCTGPTGSSGRMPAYIGRSRGSFSDLPFLATQGLCHSAVLLRPTNTLPFRNPAASFSIHPLSKGGHSTFR